MLEDVEKLTKIRQTTKIPRAKILAKFEEINKMRSEIQKMDQTTIAEVGFIKKMIKLDLLWTKLGQNWARRGPGLG